MSKILFLLLLVFTGSLQAQQNSRYLIRAGHFFNSETGQFMPAMSILVENNKIVAVKSNSQVSDDEQAKFMLIDLSRYTVLPGLIDSHTHLLNREVLYPENNITGLDMGKVLTLEGDAYRAIYGAARAKAYLEAGITAVQDLGNSGQFADVALRRAIEEKLVTGPRMRCSGPGLSTEGGQLPGLIYKHRHIVDDEYRIVKGVEDARQAVRENRTQGADVIKIFANNTPNNTSLSIEEIQAIVREAHRYNMRVTAHATSNSAAHAAVLGGVDGIEHGYQLHDSTLELMAKKNVILVPTDGDSILLVQYAKLAYPNDTGIAANMAAYRKYSADRIQRALKKGVMIAAGSDDYIDFKLPFSEPSKRNLIGYAEAGVSIPQVLQSATINAAKHLNWSKQIGNIKQGFLADIIAVNPDIKTNMNAILDVHFVMKDGVIVVNK